MAAIVSQRRALFLAVAGFLALEAALWVLAPQPDPLERRGGRVHRFLPAWNYYGEPPLEAPPPEGRLNGVARNDRLVKINRYGFLYPEEKFRRSSRDEYRIAVLGGSTTECIALRAEHRVTAVLERLLQAEDPTVPVTVLNLGISSQATWTHLANVGQHVVDLDVDLIVLLVGGNDLVRARQDDELMLIDPMFAASPSLTPAVLARWLSLRLQTVRWLRKGYLALWKQDSQEPYFLPVVRYLTDVPVLDFEPRFKAEALDGYEKAIVSIAALARAHDIDALFLTQPMLWRRDNTPEENGVFWMIQYQHEGRLAKLAPGVAAHMLETLNARLLDTCFRRGLQCLDLAAAVPRSLEFFYDDIHFNDRGAARVAGEVAKAVGPMVRRAREAVRRTPTAGEAASAAPAEGR
jgi:lysophospholipase L1-like esterase